MSNVKGFTRSELGIATEAFVRSELERKRKTAMDWAKKPVMEIGLRRLNGEILALESVLAFMVRNAK